MRRFILLLFLLTITGCSSPETPTPPATATLPAADPPSLVSMPAASASPTVPPLDLAQQPDWAGSIEATNGGIESILVHFTETGGALTIQPQSDPLEIRAVQVSGTALAFTAAGDPEMAFTGAWADGRLSGQVERDGQIDTFSLLPLYTGEQTLIDFAGTYRFETGEALTAHLSPSFSASGLDFFWSGLSLTHFGSGAIRGLYPIAPDTFLVGSARVLGGPFEAQITFNRTEDGSVDGLTWEARDPATGAPSGSQTAPRLELLTETVSYPSADGITLTGLLTLPASPGPHPAVVVMHGSERGERDDFFRQQMRTYLASLGYAALTYDKRGVGDSGGTYRESASEENLSLNAQDAVAGVEFLKTRPEIDPAHIGLLGISQSGWSVPLAAAQSPDVAFFVLFSGPTVSVGIEGAYSELTNNGASPSGYTAEEISAVLAGRTPSGFDPAPVIAGLSQPGLWLFGDQDKSIPILESAAILDTLITGGRTQFAYHVFSNADHGLQQSTQGLFTEIPYASGYHADLFPLLTEWLNAQAPVSSTSGDGQLLTLSP